ncbi:hypothetical protein ACFOWX_04670 [Sphingorhabdus arenilitoris]|uniref:Uncharacterized protein n=1 Tax=Sphingorhabdus arenilitoris TaxID=1490041 RepID=A0ABV8RHI4_9SPHN
MTEIPPDRFPKAWQEFRSTGRVTESRVRAFPEYTDAIFPLAEEVGIQLVPAAAWTQEIADSRDKALINISKDEGRKAEWGEHQAAQKAYGAAVAGRSDDPIFIHSREYDSIVAKAQAPYQSYFEKDLGPGGWLAINQAHLALINGALDKVSGQNQVIVITFGSWHKYMLINGLMKRNDVVLRDSTSLFR